MHSLIILHDEVEERRKGEEKGAREVDEEEEDDPLCARLDKTWGWMRLEARETTEEGLEEVGGLWPGRKKKRLGWSERASPGSEEDQVDS